MLTIAAKLWSYLQTLYHHHVTAHLIWKVRKFIYRYQVIPTGSPKHQINTNFICYYVNAFTVTFLATHTFLNYPNCSNKDYRLNTKPTCFTLCQNLGRVVTCASGFFLDAFIVLNTSPQHEPVLFRDVCDFRIENSSQRITWLGSRSFCQVIATAGHFLNFALRDQWPIRLYCDL